MKNFNQKFIYQIILFSVKQLLIHKFEIDPFLISETVIIIETIRKKLFL